MQNFFVKYYRFITFCFIATILIACVVLFYNREVFLYSSDTDSLLEGDARTKETTGFIADSIENDTWLAFVFECNNILQKENLEKYRVFCEELRSLHEYRGMLGLANILVPKVLENGKVNPRFELLIRKQIYEENNWEEIKNSCLETSYIKNVIVTEDFAYASLLVRFKLEETSSAQINEFIERINQKINAVSSADFKVYKIGMPILKKEIQTSILSNLFVKGSIALVLILICLIYICRRFAYFFNLVFSILLSFVLLFLVVFSFSLPLDFYLLLLIPIVITIQLTFSVHLYIAMQKLESQNENLPFIEIASQAVSEILKPSIFACLTTVIGLLSFVLSPLPELQLFGSFGAIALVIVLFVSFGPGVSILIAFRKKKKNIQINKNSFGFVFFKNSKNYIYPSFILFVIFCAAVLHIHKIKTDERILQYLPNKSEMKEGLSILSDKFGGIHMFKIEIDSNKLNGANDAEFLAYLIEIHKITEKHKKVSAVYSYAQLVSQVNEKFIEAIDHSSFSFLKKVVSAESIKGEIQIPSPLVMSTISNVLNVYNPSGIELLLDKNSQKSTMFIRTKDMPSEEYVALINEIVSESEKIKPKAYKINLLEGIHEYMAKENQIKDSLIYSYISSICPIFLMLYILFRSVTVSLVLVIINAAAVAMMLGFTGYMGISLNSITVLAGSLAFGVAVDDSIHLINQFQIYRSKMSVEEAIKCTYETKNRAIIGTSLLIIFTAIFFWMIDFTPISNFGLVTVVSMSSALLLNLFVLPFYLRYSSIK